MAKVIMQNFRNLQVWQLAHQLTLDVYRATGSFPPEERYGLTSQLRRSSSSVPSNIAEGCGRGTDADFARFVQVAMGSATEVEYQLLLAHDLSYLSAALHRDLTSRCQQLKRMLIGLLKRLHANP